MKNDNFQNKILKSTLSKRNLKPLQPQRINIKTIIKPKNNCNILSKPNKAKNYFETNEVNLKEKSFNSSFNSNENSILNKNKSIYISDYLNNSLLSNYTIYTTKKRKYRRNEKRKKNIDIKETTFLIRLNQ